MRVSVFFPALLGITGVTANRMAENPHKKAEQIDQMLKRRAATPNTDNANSNHGQSLHLTDKTKSSSAATTDFCTTTDG